MCLAIVGRVVEILGGVALVDFGGVLREVRIDLVPDVEVGSFVLVHAGFAIERLSHETAEDILSAWREVLEGP